LPVATADCFIRMSSDDVEGCQYFPIWIYIFIIFINPIASIENDPSQCLITGPGIIPNRIVLPARYFFIQSTERCHGYSI
jgi:hypothetical protein